MKTYKLVEKDVLKLAPDDSDVAEGLEARPLEALGLYAETGELVGVKLPDIALRAPVRPTPEEMEAARQEFLRAINSIPKLTPPEGKPFNPNHPTLKLSDEEFNEFMKVLEDQRRPEPWRDPWDLP